MSDDRAESDASAEAHKWADVRGWGGAIGGTVQCDRCNRVASPTNPNRQALLDSSCSRPRTASSGASA